MMDNAIYNVDKEFPFSLPLVVYCKSVTLFKDKSDKEFGLDSTSPNFLARLRRVQYDGSIAGISSIEPCEFNSVFLILYPSGELNIAFDSKDSAGGHFHALSMSHYSFKTLEDGLEHIHLTDIDLNNFGPHGEFISMWEEDFNNFINDYKIKRTFVSKRKNSVKAEEATWGDYESEYQLD